MEFDNVKENIQPLATGRNVSLLQASLSLESSQELLAQRKQLEDDIRNYKGIDPLDPWYNYISWIEQSYPAGGSGAGLQKVMHKCLSLFEREERYKQDRRLIKLFIKFMEKQDDQIECYQQMYNNGIGSMVADFYIAWAYSYDLSGNLRKADEIFRLGLSCRADPLEELKEAHQHFGFTVAQRTLYSEGDEANAVTLELNERRLALQSLHGQRRKNAVGSVRTGAAIRSHLPGVVQNEQPSGSRLRNAGRQVEVFHDENADVNIPQPIEQPLEQEESGKSSLRSIIDAARHQENLKEPGPWNKAHGKPHKHGQLFAGGAAQQDLAFPIHVDANPLIPNYENSLDKPFKYPPHFVAKNKKQDLWLTPVALEEDPCSGGGGIPCYNKCMLYPRPNMEFSVEEYRAYRYLKRSQPSHPFVLRNAEWWDKPANGSIGNVRLYPNFAKCAKPQPHDELDAYHKPPVMSGFHGQFDQMYDDAEQQEYQLEERLAAKWHERRNGTVLGAFDMEETVCQLAEGSAQRPRRKSFFPNYTPGQSGSRASLAMTNSRNEKSVLRKMCSAVQEENEEEEQSEKPMLEMLDPPPVDSLVPPATVKSFLIFEEQASPPAAAAEPEIEPIPIAVAQKFEIFESVGDGDNFVAPTRPAAIAKKFEIFQDIPAAPQPPAVPAKQPPSAYFDADETCSTVMFNNFIKSQAQVSTPKAPQKQAPARQFGTVLKELTPPSEELMSPEDPQAAAPAQLLNSAESETPPQRKQLSTILETSEHAVATIMTTKSSNASSSPSLTLTMKSDTSQQLAATTPAASRLQRQEAIDQPSNSMGVASNQQLLEAGLRLQLWEPNVPSVPLMKSLMRFQEDKTETVPRFVAFQEDKTETLPKMPTHCVEPNASKLLLSPPAVPAAPLPLLQHEDDDDLCGFFAKSPPKLNTFASPLVAHNAKRVCDQATPEAFGKSAKQSFAVFEDEMCQLPAAKPNTSKLLRSFTEPATTITKVTSMQKLADSFMADLSFVPDTQPAPGGLQPAALQQQFQIFLDETLPEMPPPAAKCASFELDCTLPETQQPPLPPLAMEKENLLAKSLAVDKQETIGPAHMTASFMKDCSEIIQRPVVEQVAEPVSLPKSNSSLKFLDNSLGGNSSLKFLNDSMKKLEMTPPRGGAPAAMTDQLPSNYFELNAATEMFAANRSGIKNSTLLPKVMDLEPPSKRSKSPLMLPPPAALSTLLPTSSASAGFDAEMSIYYTKTPVTPKQSRHSWHEEDFQTPNFVHPKPNMEQSVLNATLAESNVNPFNVDLINSLLDSIEFSLYIEKLPTCQLLGHVKRLQPNSTLKVHEDSFDVLKIIGKGAYGSVFSGKDCKTGKKVALKQEQPTNYWEYYVCLEVHSRLTSEQMIPAYMQIDHALVGNNCSVFVSELSDYGSLIAVCNKIKKHSNKNVDEYVAMHLSCQLLDIVDHLHAMGIIHADIKGDNFLLMKPLCVDPNKISLQLIDFGVSIDTKLFPSHTTFNYVHNDDAFKCIEMRMQRSWTYQLDLYGLVGVMHVLLFGRYMEVAKRESSGIWMPKTPMPRYFNKLLWESIFRTLLNVRDCRTMPNLQQLRTLLKSQMAEKEKYVADAIANFNKMLKM